MLMWYASKDEIEDEEALNNLLTLVSTSEQSYARQYVHLDDRKRSILSMLLQHTLIRSALSVKTSEYGIFRSRENKPFVRLNNKSSGNWNYNVSHHGRFVAIACSSKELIGIDIVDTLTRAPAMANNATEFINIYRKQLSRREINELSMINNDDLKYIHFFILWALKESFIKAIGAGFGFDPSKADFVVSYSSSSIVDNVNVEGVKGVAVATISNEPRRDWFFEFRGLDDHHLLAVARGPIIDSIASFREAAGLDDRDNTIPESTCQFCAEYKSITELYDLCK